MSVSSRHEGTLGGRLLPFNESFQVDVDVEVDANLTAERGVQHCAWMLVNILSRLEGIVRSVGFTCLEHVRIHERVVPEVSSSYFDAAVLEAAENLNVVPVRRGRVGGLRLVVGNTPGEAGWAVFGSGWTGGISKSAIRPPVTPSTLPFGPYVAACIAAGEVFKFARLPESAYTAPDSAFFSAWTLRAAGAPDYAGPGRIVIDLDALFAGVGAVGCTAVHCLWACDGIGGSVVLADNDRKGVDDTNLNRYPFFARGSLGKPKAAEAARIADTSAIRWTPIETPAEEADFEWSSKRVLSAVDHNHSRAAIQDKYPARIIGASTSDLRAEIIRCGPPGIGPCLRCFNPPELLKSDDEMRKQLGGAGEEVVRSIAAAADVSAEDAAAWIASGRCGTAGGRLLTQLRRTEAEPEQFAVGFVSVLAGTLGAAELVKDSMGANVPLSDREQRATFQFWAPTSPTNCSKAAMADPACPKCASPGRTAIALRRFVALNPKR